MKYREVTRKVIMSSQIGHADSDRWRQQFVADRWETRWLVSTAEFTTFWSRVYD